MDTRAAKLGDEELMYRVSIGELNYAAELFERHHVNLYNFFLNAPNDPVMSEDLTYMVFERMLIYRRSYKQGRSFLNWLYSIARNVRYDSRKRIHQVVRSMDTQAIEELSVPDPGQTEDSEVQRLLDRFLDTELGEPDKELFIMTRLLGMTSQEAGAAFGLAPHSVKKRMQRAIVKLKDYYFKMKKGV